MIKEKGVAAAKELGLLGAFFAVPHAAQPTPHKVPQFAASAQRYMRCTQLLVNVKHLAFRHREYN